MRKHHNKLYYSKYRFKTIFKLPGSLCFYPTTDQYLQELIDKNHCGNFSKINVVKEKYLESAMEIAEYFSINFEPSAIAGLGLFLQLSYNNKIQIKDNEKVIFINTGKCKIVNNE